MPDQWFTSRDTKASPKKKKATSKGMSEAEKDKAAKAMPGQAGKAARALRERDKKIKDL